MKAPYALFIANLSENIDTTSSGGRLIFHITVRLRSSRELSSVKGHTDLSVNHS